MPKCNKKSVENSGDVCTIRRDLSATYWCHFDKNLCKFGSWLNEWIYRFHWNVAILIICDKRCPFQWFLSFNWNFVSLCLMFLLTWNVLLCPIATVVLYRVRSQVVTSSSADNIYNSQPITEHFLKTTPGTKSPFLWKTGLTTDVLLLKGHGKCTPSLSNINRQQNMAR